jgi:hypothetical protein
MRGLWGSVFSRTPASVAPVAKEYGVSELHNAILAQDKAAIMRLMEDDAEFLRATNDGMWA